MKYKVAFHRGDDLSLKTRDEQGQAWLEDDGLHVDVPTGRVLISKKDLLSAELFRLHGLGRVIRIETRSGRLFLTVVRLMIGQFAFINFFKTGRCRSNFQKLASPARRSYSQPFVLAIRAASTLLLAPSLLIASER